MNERGSNERRNESENGPENRRMELTDARMSRWIDEWAHTCANEWMDDDCEIANEGVDERPTRDGEREDGVNKQTYEWM